MVNGVVLLLGFCGRHTRNCKPLLFNINRPITTNCTFALRLGALNVALFFYRDRFSLATHTERSLFRGHWTPGTTIVLRF